MAAFLRVAIGQAIRSLSPRTATGCGTQHPLRYRLHLAGRGPNSNSLFPPPAAVVAVAELQSRPNACAPGPHPQVIRRRNSLPSCPAHCPFYHSRIYLQIVQKLHKEMPRLSGNIRVQSGRCKDTSPKPTRAFTCGGRCSSTTQQVLMKTLSPVPCQAIARAADRLPNPS